LYARTWPDTAVLVQQPGMPPQMMNGMHPQQMHAGLQSMMQPNRGMPQRPREGPEGEPAPKRPRVNLGSNQGTSLLEAFNADEIKTHLTMLRSRPGETLLRSVCTAGCMLVICIACTNVSQLAPCNRISVLCVSYQGYQDIKCYQATVFLVTCIAHQAPIGFVMLP